MSAILSTRGTNSPTALFLSLGPLHFRLAPIQPEARMSADKRFMAWKRHQRRRKAAKAKVKEYDQGKIKHDQLNSLAQIFHARKMRFLTKAS